MVVFIEGRIANKTKVEHYCRKILGHFGLLNKSGHVIVQFKTKLDGNNAGLTLGNRNEVVVEIAKTQDGDKLEYSQMLITLAHELVHAKQFLRGELISYGKIIWMKRDFSKIKLDYFDLPWEVEAYELERDLFEKYWLVK